MNSQGSQRGQPSQTSLGGIFAFTLILWKLSDWLAQTQPQHCRHHADSVHSRRPLRTVQPGAASTHYPPSPLIRGAEHKHQVAQEKALGNSHPCSAWTSPSPLKNVTTRRRSAQFTSDFFFFFTSQSSLITCHLPFLATGCLLWLNKVADINHTRLNNNMQLHRKQVCCSSSAATGQVHLLGWLDAQTCLVGAK